jgi:hypothetical protein
VQHDDECRPDEGDAKTMKSEAAAAAPRRKIRRAKSPEQELPMPIVPEHEWKWSWCVHQHCAWLTPFMLETMERGP